MVNILYFKLEKKKKNWMKFWMSVLLMHLILYSKIEIGFKESSTLAIRFEDESFHAINFYFKFCFHLSHEITKAEIRTKQLTNGL